MGISFNYDTSVSSLHFPLFYAQSYQNLPQSLEHSQNYHLLNSDFMQQKPYLKGPSFIKTLFPIMLSIRTKIFGTVDLGNRFLELYTAALEFIVLIMFQINKEESKKKLRFKDLPPHLQQKYKNSPIFEKENAYPTKKLNFDLQKLQSRKAEKQKTIEQKLQEININPTQQKYLMRVFNDLSSCYGNKYFTQFQVRQVLKKMGVKMTKSEVDLMLWEFDERLDKKITQKEFINMYKRCTLDKKAAESKNLFHLTQFLMYCRPDNYRITVEDTLELLFVRAKSEVEKNNHHCEEKDIIRKLEQEIEVIFEGEEKTAEGLEKEIGFAEYLERINKRAVEMRKREIEKAKSALKYGSKCLDNDD